MISLSLTIISHSLMIALIQLTLLERLAFSQDIVGNSQSLMSLISPRDIAELTQVATQFAAQTFKSNGEVLSNLGPEVKPVKLDATPSEIFGQSLTNMMNPARKGLANALSQQQPYQIPQNQAKPLAVGSPYGRMMNPSSSNNGAPLIQQLAGNFFGGMMKEATDNADNAAAPMPTYEKSDNLMGMDGMVGQAMRLLSGGRTAQNPAGGGPISDNKFEMKNTNTPNMMPTLNQFFPNADRNFGFRRGEGCVPFLGEFMTMAYGNCVKRADEKTWDTWGKEISNAVMGGKVDLLRASKETCKMGAEREHCGQLKKAISECDILGSIQMATNLQRSVSRCDEVTGLIDQNPSTVLNQMNGLINGEMAQGFLNNFLG